jgi:hypothetical protein
MLFRLFSNEDQRFFTVAREPQFDQLVSEVDPNLDNEVVSI